jgi:NADPH:quinone reductase-like Zn-dependent oxidoreductase
VQDAYGDSSALRLDDVPMPVAGPGQVLVEVRATSLHVGDWHLMAGLPLLVRPFLGLRGPRQRIRGMDVAGLVHSVGAGVTAVAPGDEVFGVVDGGLAQFAVGSASKLAPKPASLTYEQAAAIPTSAATALHAVRDVGRVRPGQRVLVIGASGGVGIFATQLARAFGAHVTGVGSSAKLDLVRSLGADDTIDYTTTGLSGRYDLIVDTAGLRSLGSLRRLLTPAGTLVIVGGEGGSRLLGGLGRTLAAPLAGAFSKQRLLGLVSTTSAADIATLAGLVEAGELRPVLDGTYALDDAAEAMARLESGRAVGKVVVAPPYRPSP